jgi:hypothetical protein
MCPAVHMSARILQRPSSTHEPSDPPFRVVSFAIFTASKAEAPTYAEEVQIRERHTQQPPPEARPLRSSSGRGIYRRVLSLYIMPYTPLFGGSTITVFLRAGGKNMRSPKITLVTLFHNLPSPRNTCAHVRRRGPDRREAHPTAATGSSTMTVFLRTGDLSTGTFAIYNALHAALRRLDHYSLPPGGGQKHAITEDYSRHLVPQSAVTKEHLRPRTQKRSRSERGTPNSRHRKLDHDSLPPDGGFIDGYFRYI